MRNRGVLVLALGLAACGSQAVEAPEAVEQRGIDRSVSDIKAAEAAMEAPVAVSKSVGELTGKAPAAAKGEQEAPAPAEG